VKNGSLMSWIKLAGSVVLIGLAGIVAVVCLIGSGMTACSYAGSRTENVMATIHVGDTRESVIAKMGTPSDIEPPFAKYGRYDAQKCQGECVERLWYEHRLCLDETWSVELDKSNNVIATGHVVSP